ncbi:MAG: divalent-cation tolerance protein CutA [Prochloraceae cyanobacterium]
MELFYVTLNTTDEARQISHKLLEQKLAVCTNWFPITCAYRWEGEIKEEPEFVLIIKTQQHYREDIEQLIRESIDYTNFIGEISVRSVNEGFVQWLDREIPPKPLKRTI